MTIFFIKKKFLPNRWSFNGGDVPMNVFVTYSASITMLTVVGATEMNSGEYTCIATNSLNGVVRDDTAFVNVIGKCIQFNKPRCLYNVHVY